jgi:hypothetical protein
MNTRPLALFALVSLCGCELAPDNFLVASPSGPTESDGQPTSGAIVATVGPAGGVVAGPEGGALAGVVLTVPAGALSSQTTIRIASVFNGTPLPEGAESIGPYVSVTADGRDNLNIFSEVGATLTLPSYREKLAVYGADTIGVKVWYIASGTWVLTTVDSVDTSEFNPGATGPSANITVIDGGVYGAGVKVLPTGPTTTACGSRPDCTVTVPAADCSATGWCVERLTLDPPANTGMITTNGDEVRYLVRLDDSRVQEYRVNPPYAAAVAGPTFDVLTGDLTRDYGYVVSASGESVLGTRSNTSPSATFSVVGVDDGGQVLTVSAVNGVLNLENRVADSSLENGSADLAELRGRLWVTPDDVGVHIGAGPHVFHASRTQSGWQVDGAATLPVPLIDAPAKGHAIGADWKLYRHGVSAVTDLPRLGQIERADGGVWLGTIDVAGLVWMTESAQTFGFNLAPAGATPGDNWRHVIESLSATTGTGIAGLTRGGDLVVLRFVP